MDFEKYFEAQSIKGDLQGCMAKNTADSLRIFCEQEPEFAQAIEQSGKSFQQCLDTLAAAVKAAKHGNVASLSDNATFSKAVEFYFPGAKVHCDMRIDLIGDADREPPKTLTASFDSLLDF
ncbi:MAG: hypothetical protein IJV58_04060 [Oscillospiraceae bacterium]|nr:hypothetical protein [Oscillospiraceae bacterium]